jgi:Kef-type K+ transport system membrane component KefB
MPLFFTYSGLRTEFGLMDTARTWGFFILIFSVAFISKVVGCAAAARYNSKTKTRRIAI